MLDGFYLACLRRLFQARLALALLLRGADHKGVLARRPKRRSSL